MSFMWIAIVTGLVLLAASVAAWWYTRSPAVSLNDRYVAEPLLAREQTAVFDYLTKTFPGHLVVPHVLLRNMLSVRRAASPQQARERLGEHKVDFVVCGADGRPLFAFDLEKHPLSDAAAKEQQARIKSRMLKTAGVRLVPMKSNIQHMPTPDAFREQLNLAALPRPQFNRRATDRGQLTPRQRLESYFSEFDSVQSSCGFKKSEILDLTDVTDLTGLPELDEMLGRPGSRRVQKGHSSSQAFQPGRNGFDGGLSNLRGG